MQQKIHWISKYIAIALLFCGCASFTSPPKQDFSAPPLEKVFIEPFDNVWRATLLVMSKYPMKVSDMDSGTYETQPIRGEKAWKSPDAPPLTGGQRYKIIIKILKGRDAKNREACRLTILKQAEIQRDFFSEFEKQSSDGLEEKSIMYRIERELQIEKALKKVKRDI